MKSTPTFYRPETWRREDSIGYLMGRTINIVKEAVDDELDGTGLTHAQVNGELNRRAGIKRVAQATLDQLERRLRVADRWMAQAR